MQVKIIHMPKKKGETKAKYLKRMKKVQKVNKVKTKKARKRAPAFVLNTVNVEQAVKGKSLKEVHDIIAKMMDVVGETNPDTEKLKDLMSGNGGQGRLTTAEAEKRGAKFLKGWGLSIMLLGADNKKDSDEIESFQMLSLGMKEGNVINAVMTILKDRILSEPDTVERLQRLKAVREMFVKLEEHVLEETVDEATPEEMLKTIDKVKKDLLPKLNPKDQKELKETINDLTGSMDKVSHLKSTLEGMGIGSVKRVKSNLKDKESEWGAVNMPAGMKKEIKAQYMKSDRDGKNNIRRMLKAGGYLDDDWDENGHLKGCTGDHD